MNKMGTSFLQDMQDVIEKHNASLYFKNGYMNFSVKDETGKETFKSQIRIGIDIDAESFKKSVKDWGKP